MKKNTVRLFILALAMGGSLSVFAQTKNGARVKMDDVSVRRLKELSASYKLKSETERAEAVRLAELNNWPLVLKDKEGNISTLTRVDKAGLPVYKGTFNVGSAITSRTNHLQPNGSLGLNLTGAFSDEDLMMIGVWDGGYPRSTHLDLVGRTHPYDGGSGLADHPTHVTGTIIGDGSSAANSRGMAYEAMSLNGHYDNDSAYMPLFAAEGYVLSNHSYGINQSLLTPPQREEMRGSYISDSRFVDDLMFIAPYYQIVLAAGNDGEGDYDILTDMSCSKNGLAVAAVTQVNDYVDAGSVSIAGFSSWGPTNDKRIKPDIATKGVAVYSTTVDTNTSHGSQQGTSMAAPGITGTLALLQQYYAILHPSSGQTKNFMKSATVRALVAHSADEAGDGPGPDPQYGWGLMNAKRAAELLTADNQNTNAKVQELVLTPQQTYEYQVTASGTEPLVATLAWTDPPANLTNSSNPVLINDLDIKVKKGTTTHLPWRLDADTGTYAEKGDNKVDNIEKVEVENASGIYTITVTHKKNTLQNPNGSPEQEFSLIVSGITNAPVSVADNKAKIFSVWPNPAQGQINVSLSTGAEPGANAKIYDVQGRIVRSAELKADTNVIDVQDLAGGVYMVTVANGNRTDVEKVIIK